MVKTVQPVLMHANTNVLKPINFLIARIVKVEPIGMWIVVLLVILIVTTSVQR